MLKIDNKRKRIIIYLVTIFLTCSIYGFISTTNIDTGDDELYEEHSEIIKTRNPKISDTYINIITPESKIYTEPMSGYYPATYGFESDAIGTSGMDIAFVDLANLYDGNVEIVESWQGHKNVLRLQDDATAGVGPVIGHYMTANTSGAIEFYIGSDDVSGKWHVVLFDCSTPCFAIILHINNNKLYYQNAGGNFEILDVSSDTFYHIKIVWYLDDTFDLYVDGILKVDGVSNFGSQTNGIDALTISATGDSESCLYLDAVGVFRGDPYYAPGDNLNEGLLLSFEIDFTPDWIGYSLDGYPSKTILGNTVIPMLTDGSHTIQVFGKDSLGTMYQSDVRTFIIDTSITPYINIITPEDKTYTGPMTGYYPGTHGFEDVDDGSLRSDYVYLIGGTNPQPSLCGAEVISYKSDAAGNRHDKVIELRDYGGTSVPEVSINFLEPGSMNARDCTIEFYTLITKDSGTFYQSAFAIRGDLGWIAYLQWYKWSSSGNPDIRYVDGPTAIDSGIDQPWNTWYRYSLDLSCDGGYAGLGANQWRFRIYNEEGTLIYTSGILAFNVDHPTGGPYRFYLHSSQTQTTIREYVDAIGITGLEDDYQIGDNSKEGLFLSFETSFTPDWIGYSLDGQSIKTILGITTIPMPSSGPHIIQVFATDSLGGYHESEIRSFIVE